MEARKAHLRGHAANKTVRYIIYIQRSTMTYVCLKVWMGEGFFDSDPLLRIECLKLYMSKMHSN